MSQMLFCFALQAIMFSLCSMCNSNSPTIQSQHTLIAKGWRLNEDLMYFEAEGAAHNEAAWAQRTGAILKYLFPHP